MDDNCYKLPRKVIEDKRLNSFQIALLVALFSYKNGDSEIKVSLDALKRDSKVPGKILIRSLERLEDLGWINIKSDFSDQKLSIILKEPDIKAINTREYGQKIVEAWKKSFGTRLLKYEDLQDLLDFILKYGMEEKLVLKIIEYSGKNAKGDPFRYARAILYNLHQQGILTLSEYQKKENGTKKKDSTAIKDEEDYEKEYRRKLEEYYKKGYR